MNLCLTSLISMNLIRAHFLINACYLVTWLLGYLICGNSIMKLLSPVEPFSAVKIGTVEFSPVPRSI